MAAQRGHDRAIRLNRTGGKSMVIDSANGCGSSRFGTGGEPVARLSTAPACGHRASRQAAHCPGGQRRLKKAVEDQGLTIEEYNSIIVVAQNDPDVRNKILQRMHPPGEEKQ
jgi:hypothetical protein